MLIAGGRRCAAIPFAVIGIAAIIGGGLIAAVTARSPSEHATWAAAYLVLVAGVAQVALGVGQDLLSSPMSSTGIVATEVIGWNLGNAAVIVGTVLVLTPLVDMGGILLVLTLLLILLVSIPIGLILARVRAR